ncbi:MFS transporter [Pseudothauera lacus]|uniref:MFS transporter n=1 Tax=Pseudothauera lacus TaxID=2136175 RepID=A0A2T4IFH4_9RHOO|nr:MFS transporter [Pseudothauera lacus]PTD96524.1 MFS transporter [Pseudothauera lacus]
MSAAPVPPTRAVLIRIVVALGVVQIITWGILYYSIAVLAAPIAGDLLLSQSTVFAAFSAALAVSGLASPRVGRAIDSHGGRRVLTAGCVLGALAFALIATAAGPLTLFAGWALVGVANAACTYDAAFPALSQLAGSSYRKALTALTLFGGLASTVFWPLAWMLEAHAGWRLTCFALAAILLLIAAPLCWFALPDARRTPARDTPDEHPPAPAPRAGGAAFMWLAASFALGAFVVSAVGAHAVGALAASGLNPQTAILAASLIGPMQVIGRMLEFAAGARVSPLQVGKAAFIVSFAGMLMLWLAGLSPWLAFGFAACYGMANGVMTIVRGTVPGELFGRAAYGDTMGRLARPAFLAKAAAPLAIALLVADGSGYDTMGAVLAAITALALGAFLAANATARRK